MRSRKRIVMFFLAFTLAGGDGSIPTLATRIFISTDNILMQTQALSPAGDVFFHPLSITTRASMSLSGAARELMLVQMGWTNPDDVEKRLSAHVLTLNERKLRIHTRLGEQLKDRTYWIHPVPEGMKHLERVTLLALDTFGGPAAYTALMKEANSVDLVQFGFDGAIDAPEQMIIRQEPVAYGISITHARVYLNAALLRPGREDAFLGAVIKALENIITPPISNKNKEVKTTPFSLLRWADVVGEQGVKEALQSLPGDYEPLLALFETLLANQVSTFEPRLPSAHNGNGSNGNGNGAMRDGSRLRTWVVENEDLVHHLVEETIQVIEQRHHGFTTFQGDYRHGESRELMLVPLRSNQIASAA